MGKSILFPQLCPLTERFAVKTIETKDDLRDFLDDKRRAGRRIALVPTMGALHEGHLSLIRHALRTADVVVCSIFVNPTQFNDPKDLEKYPRPIENDLLLLEKSGCDVAFLPSVAEIYPPDDLAWHIDLGGLEAVWEGEKRPGHFQGVAQVVGKLFRIVQPDLACFGQKDFQQVMVVQRIIDVEKLPIRLHICPTVRSADGLALSSRNVRLSEAGKTKALALSRALRHIRAHFGQRPPGQLRTEALAILQAEGGVDVDYLAICESASLREIDAIRPEQDHVALLAAWVEGVRLIDNMVL